MHHKPKKGDLVKITSLDIGDPEVLKIGTTGIVLEDEEEYCNSPYINWNVKPNEWLNKGRGLTKENTCYAMRIDQFDLV